jgi:hypothetical protein
MPNRDLPVSGMQVLALDVEVAFTEAALVAEVLGVSPGPANATDEAQGAGRAPSQRWAGALWQPAPEVALGLRASVEFRALIRKVVVSGRALSVCRPLPGSCGRDATVREVRGSFERFSSIAGALEAGNARAPRPLLHHRDDARPVWSRHRS